MSEKWPKPVYGHHAEMMVFAPANSDKSTAFQTVYHEGYYVGKAEWDAMNAILDGLLNASAFATDDLLGDKVGGVFADWYEKRCERD